MGIKQGFYRIVATAFFLGVGAEAIALQDIPTTSGFSGNLGVAAGYTDAETNLIKGTELWDIGKSSVDSNFRSPEGEDDAFVLPTFDIAYTFGSQQIQLFLDGDVEELVDLETLSQVGIRKQFQELGIIELSYLSSGLAPQEVWADPYDATRPRSDTDREFGGVRFEWDRIAGLPIGFMIQYRDIEIDDEFSGTTIFGSGSSQAKLLSREGDDYRGEVRYTWRREANQIISPYLGYQDADLDGEAMAYSGPYIGLDAAYQGAKWGIAGRARAGTKEMSKRNPIYGTRTDADWFEIALSASYKLPWDRWFAEGSLAWAKEDNDVSFHDQRNLLLLLGAEWRFGK